MKSLPKYKICRRLGPGVHEKCQTSKFSALPPRGGKGGKRPKPLSGYGEQLLEKQKIRFSYGISERQFAGYVKKATSKKGSHAKDVLNELLECRLDNVIYRLALAPTRRAARQMVSHGHFTVNGKRTMVPSHQVHIGDVIAVREGSKGKAFFSELENKLKNYKNPAWLKFDIGAVRATVESRPVSLPDEQFNFNTVLEYYSR